MSANVVPNRRLSNRIRKLLEQYDREIQTAILNAIQGRVDSINMRDLEQAITGRDFDRVVQIVGITRADLFPVDQAITSAYVAGGQTVPAAAPAFAVAFGFDGRSTRAERWAREHVGGLITNVISDQVQAVRGVVSQQVADGIGPRKAALDIAGRITNGRRQGGIVGLSDPQTKALDRAKRELADLDGNYFTRKLRDKRFDGIVRRAIESEKPLSQTDIDRISGRYSDRLLKHRADTIARTESITALRAGRREGVQQGVEAGSINADRLTRQWNATDASRGGRTRDDHVDMNGQIVDGLNTPFVAPDGSRLLYPGDTSLGASASQTVSCFAPWTRIAQAGLTAAMRHDYTGDLIELSAGGMVNLSVTPNHPILTLRGWVSAGELNEGDSLFHCCFAERGVGAGFDVEAMQPTAEQLYNAAEVSGVTMGSSGIVVDFHGYIPDKQVDIISLPSCLGNAGEIFAFKKSLQRLFALSDVAHGTFIAERMLLASYGAFSSQAASIVRIGGAGLSIIWRGKGRATFIPFRDRGFFNSKIGKAAIHCATTFANLSSYAKDWVSRIVKSLNIRKQICARGFLNFVSANSADFMTATKFSNSNVLKARTGDLIGDANLFGNSRDTSEFIKSDFGGGQEMRASRSPMITLVRVGKIRRFHYKGPVYNFESETSVLVASGVVNHNCRCYDEYVVDWLRG